MDKKHTALNKDKLPKARKHFIVIFTLLLLFYSGSLFNFGSLTFAAEKLTAKDITLAINTYDRFVKLLNTRANNKHNKENKNFLKLFDMVTVELNDAEVQACRENSITRDHYQSVIDRIIMVKTYINCKDIRDKLADDIKRKDTMSDEDFAKEAESSYRKMEEWYNRVSNNLTFDETKKKRDEKLKQYLDSIAEQNRKIEEYNHNLPPNQKLIKLQNEISTRRIKLNNPKFAHFHDNIKRDIAQLETIANRIALKDNRRKKNKKKPDPLMLKKINKLVETYYARRKNNFYSTLIQHVQDQKTSGQWKQTVKNNNQKKIQELRFSVNKLNELLTNSRFQQAAQDADIVSHTIDSEKLMTLSPLPWQNISAFH